MTETPIIHILLFMALSLLPEKTTQFSMRVPIFEAPIIWYQIAPDTWDGYVFERNNTVTMGRWVRKDTKIIMDPNYSTTVLDTVNWLKVDAGVFYFKSTSDPIDITKSTDDQTFWITSKHSGFSGPFEIKILK